MSSYEDKLALYKQAMALLDEIERFLLEARKAHEEFIGCGSGG